MTLKRDSALSRFDLASAVVNGVNNLSLFSCGGRKGLRGMFSVGIQCTQGNNNGDKTAGARRNNLLKIALFSLQEKLVAPLIATHVVD